VLKHIALSIPEGNRWHPVFERYLHELGDRVRALGGDPDAVAPSPTGDGRPPEGRPRPGERAMDTGKVTQLRYDCFGDFEGFLLANCDGEKAFRVHQCGLEAVLHRACQDRSRVTVVSDGRGGETRIVSIVVHCC
jgi:hypothetical protein